MGEFAIAVAFTTHTEDGEPVMVNPRQLMRVLANTMTPLCVAYIPGKIAIRNAVMNEIGCSVAHAINLVEALEVHGFLQYRGAREGIDAGPGHWCFVANPRNGRRSAAT